MDNTTKRLDAVDLVLVVAIAMLLLVLFRLIEWQPPSYVVIPALAGPVTAAIALRERVLPRRHGGSMKRKVSVIGIVSVALMLFGSLLAGFVVMASFNTLGERDTSAETENTIRSLALLRARTDAELKGLNAELDAELSALDAGLEPTRGADASAVEPSAETVAKYEAEIRREFAADAEKTSAMKRGIFVRRFVWMALLALAMVSTGAIVDWHRKPDVPTS